MAAGLLASVIPNSMSDMVESERCFVTIKNGSPPNIRRYIMLFARPNYPVSMVDFGTTHALQSYQDHQNKIEALLTALTVSSHCAIAAPLDDAGEVGDESPTSTSSSSR